jgi:predicted transcriptional regulator
MTNQNVTLSIPKDILRKAKIIAVKRDTSLSALLTQALEEMVAHDDSYAEARSRHLSQLEKGFDLGTHGRITWKRDELHERR